MASAYNSPANEYTGLLRAYSDLKLSDPTIRRALPPEIVEAAYLGRPGASDAEINEAERRLGATIPPSYKQFLRLTNGWFLAGAFVGWLLPVQQIDRLRPKHEEVVAPWTNQFGPGGRADSDHASPLEPEDRSRSEDGAVIARALVSAVQISEVFDASVCLLNPEVETQPGEWEALFFAPWVPGADRFQDFGELLRYLVAD